MFYGSENFGVGVGLSIASPSHHSSRYMADQTFHTPNFGDEEFDIPPISLPPGGHETSSHGQTNIPYPMTMVHHGDQQGQQHYTTMYLPEHMSTPMTLHNSPVTYGGSPPTYTTLSSPHAPSQSPLGNSHMMHHQQQQQQQQQQGGRPQMGNPGAGPPGRSPTNSTSPTNPETATSEDSDDSVPLSHSQMGGGLKRPSPEPVMSAVSVAPKKAKPQKKKKKRDPNEPQKPVSAYALFFRDTQAAIKGQNPNASFGEVSKIVASMWDALDADHKNVYKKKTEVAKKEYLKALAAYRASLVSKGAPTDSADGSGMYPPNFNATMAPQQQQQQHYQQQGYYGNQGGGGNKKAQQQQQSPVNVNQIPLQHSPQSHQQAQQQHQQQQNHQMMQQQMIDPNQYGHNAMRHGAGAYGMNTMADGSHGMGMGGGMHLQQQQQSGGHSVPQVMSHMSNDQGHAHTHGRGGQLCVRNGCGNSSLTSPEWDDEYCSSDCVVTHCRDVFTNWVSNNPGGNPSYHPAAVNKFNGPVAGGVIGPDGLSYVT